MQCDCYSNPILSLSGWDDGVRHSAPEKEGTNKTDRLENNPETQARNNMTEKNTRRTTEQKIKKLIEGFREAKPLVS